MTRVVAGDLYVASGGTNAILQYDGLNGRFRRKLCVINKPDDVAFFQSVLYVSSSANDVIMRFRASTGSPLGLLARGPAAARPKRLVASWANAHDRQSL